MILVCGAGRHVTHFRTAFYRDENTQIASRESVSLLKSPFSITMKSTIYEYI